MGPDVDQVSWGTGGGSAHTIKEDGSALTARAGLNAGAGLLAADDAGNNETDLDSVIPMDVLIYAGISTAAWADLGAGPTELSYKLRARIDMSKADEVRLVLWYEGGGVTGLAKAQYSTDGPTFSNDLTATLPLSGSQEMKSSAWAAVPAGAKGDYYVRIVGVSGNGTEDPGVTAIRLQFR